MTSQVGVLQPLRLWAAAKWQRAAGISIFARIAIGNSLIIILGAIGGTTIIHIITERGAALVSILLFALAGVILSILLNLYILRAALEPLLELRKVVTQMRSGPILELDVSLRNPDPDTARLADTLRALIVQLSSSNRQLHILSGKAIRAQEEERMRIARSLHDETGQALLSILYALEGLEKRLPSSEAVLRAKIADAQSVAAEALESLRRIIRDLRPAVLDDLGLVSATRWYARSNLEKAGIQVEFRADAETLPLPPELNITLFRIAQEAIHNIIRHAQAKKASIRLGLDENEIYLDIQDDGIGFQVAENTGEAMRLSQWGLAGIQERVNLVNGRLILDSTPGQGTHLQVRAPLSAAQEAPDG